MQKVQNQQSILSITLQRCNDYLFLLLLLVVWFLYYVNFKSSPQQHSTCCNIKTENIHSWRWDQRILSEFLKILKKKSSNQLIDYKNSCHFVVDWLIRCSSIHKSCNREEGNWILNCEACEHGCDFISSCIQMLWMSHWVCVAAQAGCAPGSDYAGRTKSLSTCSSQTSRQKLLEENVRGACERQVEVICSCCCQRASKQPVTFAELKKDFYLHAEFNLGRGKKTL